MIDVMRTWIKNRMERVKTVIRPLLQKKTGKKILYVSYAFWLLPIALILISYLLIFKDLPSPAKLANYDIPIATKIFDRNGKLLFDIFADQNRTPVALSEIPKYLQEATVSIEESTLSVAWRVHFWQPSPTDNSKVDPPLLSNSSNLPFFHRNAP